MCFLGGAYKHCQRFFNLPAPESLPAMARKRMKHDNEDFCLFSCGSH